MQVIIKSSVDTFLAKQIKKDAENINRINIFLSELENINNPFALNNVEKIQRAKNYWRWTITKYLIIGEAINNMEAIKIIKVYRGKEDNYDKGF